MYKFTGTERWLDYEPMGCRGDAAASGEPSLAASVSPISCLKVRNGTICVVVQVKGGT